jgi:dimethylargininase
VSAGPGLHRGGEPEPANLAPAWIAWTRAVSPTLADCELTHVARAPLDVDGAIAEHAAYERLLAELGVTVQRLPPEPRLPDAVFVEDTAVVLDEVAVIARPGAASRRPETRSVEAALAAHRPLLRIEGRATLDGGDVLVIDRRVHVGLSSRTTLAAVEQLSRLLRPYDYEVVAVPFSGCLHLKSAVTRIADGLLLLNPAWVDQASFPSHAVVNVDPLEPQAANALWIGGSVIHPQHHPRTRRRLESEGLRVAPAALDELAKAEAGVTCCSLLVRIDDGAARGRPRSTQS